MRTTILGGWKEGDPREHALTGSYEEFAAACEAIGKALARKHHAVIVGSESSYSADYHIVKGIVEGAAGDDVPHPLVHVIKPEFGPMLFQDFWKQYPKVFTSYPRKQRAREATKIISVQEADA